MKLNLITISLLAAAVSSLPHYGAQFDKESATTYQPVSATTQDIYQITSYHDQPDGSDQPYDSNPPSHSYSLSYTTTESYDAASQTGTGYKPTETPSVGGKVHTVKVGGTDDSGVPILKYEPSVVYADVGDTIVYDFLFRNHTVTESTFDNPCTRMQGNPIASGFRPNIDNIPGKNTFEYTVSDTYPHWVYCGQKQPISHCQAGMVMAINPPQEGNTFEKFLQKAKEAPVSEGTTSTVYDSTTSSQTSATEYGYTASYSSNSYYPIPTATDSAESNSEWSATTIYSVTTGYEPSATSNAYTTDCSKSTATSHPVPTSSDYSSSASDHSYSTESHIDYGDAKGTEGISSASSSSSSYYPTSSVVSEIPYTTPTASDYDSHSYYPGTGPTASYMYTLNKRGSRIVPASNAPTKYAYI